MGVMYSMCADMTIRVTNLTYLTLFQLLCCVQSVVVNIVMRIINEIDFLFPLKRSSLFKMLLLDTRR